MKKLLFLLALAGIGVAGFLWFQNRNSTATVLPPKTRPADKGDICERVSVIGRTVPREYWFAGPDLLPAGKVVWVNPKAELGMEVKEGDELVKLDDEYLKLQLDQAKAKKSLAESNQHLAEAGRILADAAQARAKKANTTAKTAFDIAEKYLKEFQNKEGVKQAQEKFDIADQTLTATDAALKEAEAGIKKAEAAKAAADAHVNEADVGIRVAEKGLKPLVIKAPATGIVVKRDVMKGQVVSPTATPVLFVLANLSQMQLLAQVGESDIGRVKIGQEVRFKIDAYADDVTEFIGKVNRIADIPITTPLGSGGQKVDPAMLLNAPVIYGVTIDVLPVADKPEFRLKAGLTANIDFVLREAKDQLRVPSDALGFKPERLTPEEDKLLTERSEGPWKPIWVQRDGERQLLFVQTGISGDGKTQITKVDGKLEPGMQVIIEGAPAAEAGGLLSGKLPFKL